MIIGLMLIIPLVLSVSFLFIHKEKTIAITNAFGYCLLLCACFLFTKNFLVSRQPLSLWGWLYVDCLSVFFILTTAVTAFAASVYSVGYLAAEKEENKLSLRKVKGYFYLFNAFCFTMILVPFLNNLGFVWIAIEMTTMVSAFLVGFHNVKESIEAAWKYIIICSVGITFALLGIIFFYYTSSTHAGVKSLEWTKMIQAAPLFDAKVVKIAMVFILVGYGTKAGFAPMHNWLPDAHSQALSPISGLLSGVLLKISLYAILRFVILANFSAGYIFSAKLFMFFGMCSLAIAAVFILVQKDLKRLLAYSSVENIGLIAIGFGSGPYGGVFAGLLHIFNHAVTKAFMFFCAGSAVRAYKTNNIKKIQGMLQAIPFTGIAMFLGVFALTGMPPFGIFISKLAIMAAVFRQQRYILAAFMFIFIAVAFAGLLHHISLIVLGNKPQAMPQRKESASVKLSLAFLGVFIIGMGLQVPSFFWKLIINCQELILGQ